LLGVGVAIATPPVKVVYQANVAPATTPVAVTGKVATPWQYNVFVGTGGVGVSFTVTVIAALGPSQPPVAVLVT
jgi:hypothetical protein